MKLYRHSDILRIYPDLRPRTLISWTEKGLLSPEVSASGSGTRRKYSSKNLVEIGAIRELVSYRIPHEIISLTMERLSNKDLSEKNGFDTVIAIRRSRVSSLEGTLVDIFDVDFGSRNKFSEEADKLIFGGESSMPRVPTVIVISLGDIWKSVQARI